MSFNIKSTLITALLITLPAAYAPLVDAAGCRIGGVRYIAYAPASATSPAVPANGTLQLGFFVKYDNDHADFIRNISTKISTIVPSASPINRFLASTAPANGTTVYTVCGEYAGDSNTPPSYALGVRGLASPGILNKNDWVIKYEPYVSGFYATTGPDLSSPSAFANWLKTNDSLLYRGDGQHLGSRSFGYNLDFPESYTGNGGIYMFIRVPSAVWGDAIGQALGIAHSPTGGNYSLVVIHLAQINLPNPMFGVAF